MPSTTGTGAPALGSVSSQIGGTRNTCARANQSCREIDSRLLFSSLTTVDLLHAGWSSAMRAPSWVWFIPIDLRCWATRYPWTRGPVDLPDVDDRASSDRRATGTNWTNKEEFDLLLEVERLWKELAWLNTNLHRLRTTKLDERHRGVLTDMVREGLATSGAASGASPMRERLCRQCPPRSSRAPRSWASNCPARRAERWRVTLRPLVHHPGRVEATHSPARHREALPGPVRRGRPGTLRRIVRPQD